MKNRRILYLLTGFMIMLLAGTVYTWTIIAKSISATYPDWTARTLSMTFTIDMMGYALGGLASGTIVRRTGSKPVLMAAAVLFPGGMLLASSAQSPALLYLGFGAMCGFAAGLCYNSTVSTVSSWFPDRQGVASGTLLAAFGLSSFIAGKLFAAFAPADGSRAWAQGLRLLAVLLLAVLITGVLVMRFPGAEEAAAITGYGAEKTGEAAAIAGTAAGKPVEAAPIAGTEAGKPGEKETEIREKSKEAASTVHSPAGSGKKRPERREPACDIPTGAMIRTPSFWLFYLWAALMTGSGLLLVSQASGIAGEAAPALSGGTIATAVGMISILNAVGRICTGTVYDRFGYRITLWMVMSTFGFSAVMLLLAVRGSAFSLLLLGFIAGGFAYGGVASISPPLIADFYGRTWYAKNFSLIPTNALFTSFASVLAGLIYDRTHSFQGALMLLLAAIVLSFLISFAIRRPGEGRSAQY